MSRYFIDDSWYFITVPTKDHTSFFAGDKRSIILERIRKACDKFDISNYDFGIMADHYHFLAHFNNANIIPKFLNFINGGAAYEVGNIIGRGKEIWGEYHVLIAPNEQVYERILGYVIGNPLKHGEVADMKELIGCPFSSFSEVITERGIEFAEEAVNSVIEMDEGQFLTSFSKGTGEPA